MLGVTGWHKIYSESRGWVSVSELQIGEVVRGANGAVTVTGLERRPGRFTVYNMTVEADHVYYVGELSALTHNVWCNGLHHIEPQYLGGLANGAKINLPGAIHQFVHRIIDARLIAEFGPAVQGFGRNSAKWAAHFARYPADQARALEIARESLSDLLRYTRPLW